MPEPLRLSAVGLCQRRVYLQCHPEEFQPHVTPKAVRVMALGKLIEALRRREVRQEGTRIFGPQAEVQFRGVTGHIDGYMTVPTITLWECKSSSRWAISRWLKDNQPPRHIRYQVASYCEGLSSWLGEPVTLAKIDVVDRSSGDVHVLSVQRDQALVDDVARRIDDLATSLSTGKMPEPEYPKESPECGRCPYRSACRPLEEVGEGDSSLQDASSWLGFQEALDSYLVGQAMKEEAEGMVGQGRDELLRLLQSHEATRATCGSATVSVCSVETQKFDQKAFEKAHPDLFAQYLKAGGYRRLAVRS